MKRVLEAALRVNPKTAKAEFFDERPFVACSYGAARVSKRVFRGITFAWGDLRACLVGRVLR